MIHSVDSSGDSYSVVVYHRCGVFATGSVYGDNGSVFGHWWAEPRHTSAGWTMHIVGGTAAERPMIEEAIGAELGESPGDRVRREQDAAAEAVD